MARSISRLVNGLDLSMPLQEYWLKRLAQHHGGMYRGRSMVKLAEDLVAYQDVITEARPSLILELGTWQGGSAIWFADQMTTILGSGHVVTVDVIAPVMPIDDPRVTFVQTDLLDYEDIANALVGLDLTRVMVIDDAAHTFDVTLSSLRLYSPLVSVGSYFVVEDTIVDVPELRLRSWGECGGALQAVSKFLGEDRSFSSVPVNHGVVSMHMGGWLRRDR